MKQGQIKQKITADYILDIYLLSKTKKGKEREDLLIMAKALSQHLNEFLVAPKIIKRRKS
jgi:hypothetical protein